MKLVIDAHIPAADACFGGYGTLHRLPGREIRAADLQNADALIVRNRTRVDATLLSSGPGLRAIGRLGVGLLDAFFSRRRRRYG